MPWRVEDVNRICVSSWMRASEQDEDTSKRQEDKAGRQKIEMDGCQEISGRG